MRVRRMESSNLSWRNRRWVVLRRARRTDRVRHTISTSLYPPQVRKRQQTILNLPPFQRDLLTRQTNQSPIKTHHPKPPHSCKVSSATHPQTKPPKTPTSKPSLSLPTKTASQSPQNHNPNLNILHKNSSSVFPPRKARSVDCHRKLRMEWPRNRP